MSTRATASATAPGPRADLPGQADVTRQVVDLLAAGRSVLLFGPEAIGKSAIIEAVARDGVVVIDPLEHVGPRRAFAMRRALDRGVVYLAAARVARGRELGSLGRVLWRFSTVRVRELPDWVIRRIVLRELGGGAAPPDVERAWVREIVVMARGRPGFATAMGRFAVDWHRTHGYWPDPGLAFAASRADATIHALRASAGPRPLARTRRRPVG